jgi:aminomethyltransferase
MRRHAEGFDIDLQNLSEQYGQLAVQGPQAEATTEQLLGRPLAHMAFYTAEEMADGNGGTLIVSRTGYTGEDGFEIYASHAMIQSFWDTLINKGVQPCGLGCRDTLRFEVGLPLYGDELSEEITPIMAGLSMFVKLDKGDFIGREALLRQKTEGPAQRLVGIELEDKAIPRHGYTVLSREGEAVGQVTTGYHSISADKSVCMALVDADHAKLDTPLQIQIRKKVFPGRVVKKRFYEKHYKK